MNAPTNISTPARPPELVDGCGRRVDYVRLSLTDRCNYRCTYCMAERMVFAPRRDLLTLDELAQLGDHFVARGVRRIRLTGGEPLVRPGALNLVKRIGALLGHGLDEVTLTTNGALLAGAAEALAAAGVRRVNVSLDTLSPDRFAAVTRGGAIGPVLAGIAAARAAGLAVRVNAVAMRGVNEDEADALLGWCGARGLDLALIEAMPLGEVDEDRAARYLPLGEVRARLEQRFTLTPSQHRTAGPARYYDIAETGTRVGFITPLSDRFCAACNRIRVTATGMVHACLGHEGGADLRAPLRAGDTAALDRVLRQILRDKPARHEFDPAAARPATRRHMSVTGG